MTHDAAVSTGCLFVVIGLISLGFGARNRRRPTSETGRRVLAFMRALPGGRLVPPDSFYINIGTAERAITRVLSMQETRPNAAHRGNFRWLYEDQTVHDLNGVEFMLDGLNVIARRHEAPVSAATNDAIRRAIALGLEEIARL